MSLTESIWPLASDELVLKRYTSHVFKIAVVYMDRNLELQEFVSDGKDLKEYIESLNRKIKDLEQALYDATNI